jgi:hypothetical protein
MPDDVKGKALRDEIAYEYRKLNIDKVRCKKVKVIGGNE